MRGPERLTLPPANRADRRFARSVMVTLGALIRLAVRARRMLSFLLSYRAAPAT
jgi:hypothetical protein